MKEKDELMKIGYFDILINKKEKDSLINQNRNSSSFDYKTEQKALIGKL